MEISEFKRALDSGLGRAIPYLQTHDASPYREFILDACLHCKAYDPQTEGNKAEYMFEVIQLTHESGFFRDRILAGLALSAPDDNNDSQQLFDLAQEFAEQGDEQARKSIRDKVALNAHQGQATGIPNLIALDKLDGLVFVADKIGDTFAEYTRKISDTNDTAVIVTNIWTCHDQIEKLEKEYGEEVWHMLERAATEKPRIKQFIEAIREFRAEWFEPHQVTAIDLSTTPYAQLKVGMTDDYRPYLSAWGRQASEQDLLGAANDLLLERDTKRLFSYLHIFGHRAFPLPPDRLIALASGLDRRMAARAFNVLDQISHPAVRAFALDLIGKLELWRSVGLLAMNFQEGDYQLIEELINRSLENEQYHHQDFRSRRKIGRNGGMLKDKSEEIIENALANLV